MRRARHADGGGPGCGGFLGIVALALKQNVGMTGISRKMFSDIELDKGKPVQSIVDTLFKPFGFNAGVVPIHVRNTRITAIRKAD